MERGKGTEEGEGGRCEGRRPLTLLDCATAAATAFPPIIVLLNAPGGPYHKLALLFLNIKMLGQIQRSDQFCQVPPMTLGKLSLLPFSIAPLAAEKKLEVDLLSLSLFWHGCSPPRSLVG